MMRTNSQRMTNERGETVIIHTQEKEVNGVPSIVLSVAAPDGETELQMTKKEAVEVLDALAKLLRPRSR